MSLTTAYKKGGTVARGVRGGCRRALTHLLVYVALMGNGVGCCPDDQVESCMTLEEWRASRRCRAFPSPPEGQACPSAEAFAESCDTDVGPSRVEGDKCCYQVAPGCI